MRLWHYEIIPFLPKSQLIAQWRELNSIFKNQPKHILINYVYGLKENDYDFIDYTAWVIREIKLRGYKIKSFENANKYFEPVMGDDYNIEEDIIPEECVSEFSVFPKYHTNRYLLQCFYNLQEKFDRGQKDFSQEQYEKLKEFVSEKGLI